MTDEAHMRAALAMGRRGLGSTWPNPSVGCVIVGHGRVLARGVTAPGGRPHAEVVALDRAGPGAQGSTAYVTLEPCSHFGQTPPCADALVRAGVAQVVVGCGDPDPRVSGRGLARLRAAGIEVVEGVSRAEAETDQAGFLTRVRLGRPMVTLKLATTLDGRIATSTGESQWITGAEARRAGHMLRGSHDAVLVGIGTALADDPMLTCRLPGVRLVPEVRVVVDRQLQIRPGSRLVATARAVPTWVLHGTGVEADRSERLLQAGVRLLETEEVAGVLDLGAAMRVLAAAGLTRVLVEGGAGIAGGLLQAGLVDRVAWFHAPGVIGGDGLAGVAGFGVSGLAGIRRFRRVSVREVGEDVLSLLSAIN